MHEQFNLTMKAVFSWLNLHNPVLFSEYLLIASGFTLADQSDRCRLFAAQLKLLQDNLSRLGAMRIDPTEYACLKALVLFKSGTVEKIDLNPIDIGNCEVPHPIVSLSCYLFITYITEKISIYKFKLSVQLMPQSKITTIKDNCTVKPVYNGHLNIDKKQIDDKW